MIGLRDYSALEWTDCTVEGNASNEVRPAKSFPHAAPTAAFELPANARVGEPVRFIGTCRAARGRVATQLWDFGDAPSSSSAEASHIYAQPGEYRATLIVWDESGRGARAERLIRLEP